MTRKKKTQTDEPEVVGLSVVRHRHVSLSEMSKVRPADDQASAGGAAPNAPRPQPSQELITKIEPMRRRHKADGAKDRPSYMSDVKI